MGAASSRTRRTSRRQRRLEDQQRQEDVDEDFRADRQVGEQAARPRRLCSESCAWVSRAETAPIAAPMAASSTTGASRSRSATGWLSATRTSRAANTARMRMMSGTGSSASVAGTGRRNAARTVEAAQPGLSTMAAVSGAFWAARVLDRAVGARPVSVAVLLARLGSARGRRPGSGNEAFQKLAARFGSAGNPKQGPLLRHREEPEGRRGDPGATVADLGRSQAPRARKVLHPTPPGSPRRCAPRNDGARASPTSQATSLAPRGWGRGQTCAIRAQKCTRPRDLGQRQAAVDDPPLPLGRLQGRGGCGRGS